MKYIDDINLFKSNKDFVAEIDMTGSLGRIYHYPQRMEGCLFLLCLRGECDITIHLSEHKIQKNDIVTILPETFVHVHRQSPDCRLYLIGFNKELLNGINLFNSTMNYLSALIDTPIIPLRPEITELFQDYFRLLIKVNKITGKTVTDIIAKLVITDAEAKLKSTDFTIQEIAYSLNFPDISFFGKYFKRYTGMSPKQYREST